MSASENLPLTGINKQLLASLDKQQLLSLLQHKTQLLIATKNSGIADPDYTNSLKQAIEAIQLEIACRKD